MFHWLECNFSPFSVLTYPNRAPLLLHLSPHPISTSSSYSLPSRSLYLTITTRCFTSTISLSLIHFSDSPPSSYLPILSLSSLLTLFLYLLSHLLFSITHHCYASPSPPSYISPRTTSLGHHPLIPINTN